MPQLCMDMEATMSILTFLLSSIDKYFNGLISEIWRSEIRNRIFFSKNDVLTNVEIQHWTNIENHFSDYVINSELKRRILKAFGTSWEHRFGFYLGNGWIYVYRSYELIFRYKWQNVSINASSGGKSFLSAF